MTTKIQHFSLGTLVLLPLYISAASPWKVTDGSTLQVTSGYTSVERGDNSLYASGMGSQLVSNKRLTFVSVDGGTSVAFISDQAGLTLNNATVVATGGSTGINAFSGSKIKIANSTFLAEYSAITAHDSDISVEDSFFLDGKSAFSLYNSTLNLKGSTIRNSITGIDVYKGSMAWFDDVNISLYPGSESTALNISQSDVTGNKITINSDALDYPTVLVGNAYGKTSTLTLTDSTINSSYVGIRTMDGDLILNNVNINVTQEQKENQGNAVNLNMNSNSIIRGGSFQTYGGEKAHAILLPTAAGYDATLDVSDAFISTTGSNSYAIKAVYGSVTLKNSTLTTSGKGSYALGTNSFISGDNLIITTSGVNGHAAVACSGGSLTLINSNIETSGQLSLGVAGNLNSLITLEHISVETKGKLSHALQTDNFNVTKLFDSSLITSGESAAGIISTQTQLDIRNSDILTTGGKGRALFVNYLSEFTADNLRLATSGDDSYAFDINKSSARIYNSTISATGNNSTGLYAAGQATLEADNLQLTTSGNNSTAIVASSALINLKNSKIEARASSGGLSTGLIAKKNNNTVILDNSSLGSETGYGLNVAGATLDLTLKNGSSLYGGNGTAINLTKASMDIIITSGANEVISTNNTSNVNVVADKNSQITGSLRGMGTESTFNLTLSNGSQLKGAAKNVTRLTLDKTSSWLLTDNSDVSTLQQNGGSILFSHPSAFTTLTVKGDLTGSGEFTLNTRLGGDNSATDRVLVKGNASGAYGVTIHNRGGAGALTSLGIPVINVAGNAQSATFTQRNTVIAGNYQYVLNKVSDHDWYLQSSLTPVMLSRSAVGNNAFSLATLNVGNTDLPAAQSSSTNADTQPAAPATANKNVAVSSAATGADTGAVILPVAEANMNALSKAASENVAASSAVLAYRPETAGYLFASWLNINYGFETVGSWHERQSAARNGAAWGKIQARHDSYEAGRFAADVNTSFVQLGGDLVQRVLADGWQLKAGPMLTLGHQSSKHKDNARSIRSELSTDVGKTVTTAYGIGGYLTAWSDNGAYLDGVLQVTRYSNKFSSLTEAKMNSYGVVLSAETGYPISLGSQFTLEPQLQALGQYLDSKEVRAGGVKVQDQNLTTGQLREGVRLSYDGMVVKPWLQVDMVQFVGRVPGVKMNDETLTPDLQRNSWQASAGISGKLNQRLSAYAQVKYSHSFGAGAEGYTGGVGLEYKF